MKTFQPIIRFLTIHLLKAALSNLLEIPSKCENAWILNNHQRWTHFLLPEVKCIIGSASKEMRIFLVLRFHDWFSRAVTRFIIFFGSFIIQEHVWNPRKNVWWIRHPTSRFPGNQTWRSLRKKLRLLNPSDGKCDFSLVKSLRKAFSSRKFFRSVWLVRLGSWNSPFTSTRGWPSQKRFV